MASMVIPPTAAYAATLKLMTAPLAVWCTLSSAEMIAARGAFRPGRALGPDLLSLSRGRVIPAILASPLCSPRSLLLTPALRLAAGAMLPFADEPAAAGLFVVILGCTALLSIAMGGSDGADKIAQVACLSGLLIALGQTWDDPWLCLAGLVWAAGQVTIAYATSGVAKLVKRFWRDGTALAAVMTSYRSGHPIASRIVRHREVAAKIAWSIMLIEALCPLALLMPHPICLAVLAVLALFHVATAVVMGLNTYPWAFMATYPCVAMANLTIVGGIG